MSKHKTEQEQIDATIHRLAGILQLSGEMKVVFKMSLIELTVLHAYLSLAIKETDIQDKLSEHSKDVALRFRGLCREAWTNWGLSEEDAKIVDGSMAATAVEEEPM